MQRLLTVLGLLLLAAGPARATGILIPVERKLPPLAMVNHHVTIAIEEQVAITRIEQTFRNHSDRMLEATYIFPVPKGASVRGFTMWVDGKEVKGELVEADKARQIYTDIVRRTLDPGLLEYMGNNLLKLRVFPVPPRGDQKISISYTSINPKENGLVEYVYPLKTDEKAVTTLEKFTIRVDLKSQHPIQNIYSPSHGITVQRPNDKQAIVGFEKDQAHLDRDFQLFYSAGGKDVGLTALTHRPAAGNNGYFMLLVSPRAELVKERTVPRDMVFVLDTSGSMRGKRMAQAQNALKYCLNQLTSQDRFVCLNFATTVNKHTDNLQSATKDNIEAARKWVDTLEATGGTAINDALAAALALRNSDPGRTFTIIFFTDGRPTIGETNETQILKNVAAKNTGNTRIFTFGVGDDVNASMLDQLAESTRATCTYVREAEDIEAKVSGLYTKISNPVLTNLKLAVTSGISLTEVYPPQLPDLFHGTQLVVFGRYTGHGHTAVKLTGAVGMEAKEFVYETTFPDRTAEDKSFVEDLWARRKVGYMLDQIRINGEKKELVDEVVTLAKRYGITTPYTSYLVVPDSPIPIVRPPRPVPFPRPGPGPVPVLFRNERGGTPLVLQNAPGAPPTTVTEFLKHAQNRPGEAAEARAKLAEKDLARLPGGQSKEDGALRALQLARDRFAAQNEARREMAKGNFGNVQAGKLGVDLSIDSNFLRNQSQLSQTAQRFVAGRNLLDVGGVWIDEAFDAKMPTVTVKAQSAAYFRILERQPKVRSFFQIANHLVWVTPSGTALVIDGSSGQEEMSDANIDRLFVAKR